MPTLPIITSQSNAQALQSRGLPPTPRVDRRAFEQGDGGAASALAGVGNKLMSIAKDRADNETRLRQNEQVAEFMALNDPTPLLLEINEREKPEDLGARTQAELYSWIDERTGQIEDPALRSTVRTAYLRQMPQYVASAAKLGSARSADTAYANAIANADPTPLLTSLESEVGADGKGLYEISRTRLADWIDERSEEIDNPSARIRFKQSLQERTAGWLGGVAKRELYLSTEHAKNQMTASLGALENQVRSDPAAYDTVLQAGNALIDARTDMRQEQRNVMKETWRQDSARRRFEGLIERAATVDELDTTVAELTNPQPGMRDWRSEFKPEDFDRTLDALAKKRATINTKHTAEAKSLLTSLEERNGKLSLLEPDEIAQARNLVRNSNDSDVMIRFARLSRDQDILRRERQLPPHELRATMNGVQGGPGVVYPNLPSAISDAIRETERVTGGTVTANYLGATAMREYGGNLRAKPKSDEKFKPLAAGDDVDLRNMRAGTVSAVTTAGSLLGAPLRIVGAEKDGEGVYVATAGMDGAEKARIVGALADAGFTGFVEQDGRIGATMRAKVPSSFGERDGKFWGGWSYLSPEVAETLKGKGFAADADARSIKRTEAAPEAGIDFGKSNPNSTATGVYQFTEGTWLGLMKDGNTPQRFGLDIEGKSDAEILAMRADPRVSTMMAAAYAEQNRIQLEGALGRKVSDADLYLAHFLGPTGATAVLSTLRSQPDALAKDVVPGAANTNKSVFKDKDGVPVTVSQLYNRIAVQFNTVPERVQYGDNEMRKRILDDAEKNLKADPVSYAAKVGTHVMGDITTPEGIAQRGATVRSVANYYNIPMKDMKPLTRDEEDYYLRQIQGGNPDAILGIMASFQGMGTEEARAAYRQLGEKNKVFEFAAGLAYDRGQLSVAGDIVRGQQRLKENPDVKTLLKATDQDINGHFSKATGAALANVDPATRQAIQDAALAYYTEKVSANPKARFDTDEYEAAINAVLGGVKGKPALAEVNGAVTVLPPNVTARDVETAFSRMSEQDWANMSPAKLPPRYANGQQVSAYDLEQDANLRPIGGGQYLVVMGDGSYLTTGKMLANGRMQPYVLALDEKKVAEMLGRPRRKEATSSDFGAVP